MKNWFNMLFIFVFPLVQAAPPETDEEKCRAHVEINGNYKAAQNNVYCMGAAEAGVGSAQYAVGMAYGFVGNEILAEKYYRLAAGNGNVAAYIALGHAVRSQNVWEAIYWYQRFVATRSDGYGYGAILISELFRGLGDEAQAEYWRDVCKASPYDGCDS